MIAVQSAAFCMTLYRKRIINGTTCAHAHTPVAAHAHMPTGHTLEPGMRVRSPGHACAIARVQWPGMHARGQGSGTYAGPRRRSATRWPTPCVWCSLRCISSGCSTALSRVQERLLGGEGGAVKEQTPNYKV